jgi:hypothetical protein
MQSLVGRLAFSLCLFATAASLGALDVLDHPTMRGILLAYLGLLGVIFAVLFRMGRTTELG